MTRMSICGCVCRLGSGRERESRLRVSQIRPLFCFVYD